MKSEVSNGMQVLNYEGKNSQFKRISCLSMLMSYCVSRHGVSAEKSTQNSNVGFKDGNEGVVIHFQLLHHPFSTFLKFAAIGKCEKMCEEMSDVTSSENV